jgi:aspartyl-tRNA(Asn)/glutamyl-tRNA(Gln) amidotransferase subunit C
MAQITVKDVEKIAGLANLRFTDEEKEKFRGQLEQMVSYVEKLNELDTTNIEPTFAVQHEGTALREDEVKSSLSRDEALKNAPSQAHGFFRVPKVIERE